MIYVPPQLGTLMIKLYQLLPGCLKQTHLLWFPPPIDPFGILPQSMASANGLGDHDYPI